MTTYTTINTFVDDAFKSHIRENILNPMIVQHNQMGSDINALDTSVDRLVTKTDALQENQVSTLTDLTDVPAKVNNRYLKVNGEGTLTWAEGSGGSGSGEAGPQGPKGDKGDKGDTGAAGADGEGVPAGGLTGQILAKVDGSDFNTEWVNAPVGGEGGSVDLSNYYTKAETDAEIADLATSVNTNISDISVAEGKITAVEEEVDILNTDMISVKGKISALEDAPGGGGIPEGGLEMINLVLAPTISKHGQYTTQEVYDNVFLNARNAQTIVMPEIVASNPTGTQVLSGATRYFCAFEADLTLEGATVASADSGKQNISYGGRGADTLTIARGSTLGFVAVEAGAWSNWQVFSEVLPRLEA